MKSFEWKFRSLMAAGVLILSSGISAMAQTSTRFTVPFQFLAGEQVMPAGDYLVAVDQGNRTVNLRHEDGASATALRMIPGKRSFSPVQEGKLMFKVYGNSRVLARVWSRGFTDASDLPVSNAERELARTERAGQPVEIALATSR